MAGPRLRAEFPGLSAAAGTACQWLAGLLRQLRAEARLTRRADPGGRCERGAAARPGWSGLAGDGAGAGAGVVLAQCHLCTSAGDGWGGGLWLARGRWAVAEQPGLSFAVLLRQLRVKALLTQEELAEAAGVSPRSVSDLERGISRTARKDTALLLAGALGLAGPARELFVAVARGQAPTAQMLAAARGTFAGPIPGLPPDSSSLTGGQGQLAWLLGAVTGSPYRGLAAFEEQDAALFFGREAATAQVLERVSRHAAGAGLLMVSGVSGAGKSSLLRAGVLPRIRENGLAAAPGAASWPYLVFTPGRAPLDELALRVALLAGTDASAVRRGLDTSPEGFALPARQAALARPPGPTGDGTAAEGGQPSPRRLLLVVDQFEELFTQCADEGQRRAFITALHAAATAAHGPDQAPAALVMLGVRADFEARCADYGQLADAVQDRYLVTAMTGRQLRMAITEPAKKADSGVDADLTEALLAEVSGRQPGTSGAGMLPLLSHALDQAWRSRAGGTLTLADYERTGGIEGAVAASAQRAYDGLTLAQQAAARQVFTRLTATSAEGVDSADRATKAELTGGKTAAEAQDVETVLEAFAAERLLTFATDTVEISHEALLTAWPLLRDTWLAETHADRIARTRLHATAADWARHSRDPSYLYTGTLLAAATGTATRIGADPARHPPLSQTERDFLHASSHAHRRAIRRRQGFIALLMALVIGLASAAAFAFLAGQDAVHNAANARHQHAIALSRQLAAESLNIDGTDPVTARRLAVAAWAVLPTGQANSAITALLAEQQQQGMLPAGLSTVWAVAFSPGGKLLASAGNDGMVRLWHPATFRPVGAPLHASARYGVHGLAFSPNGKLLATAGADGTVRLWNPATCRPAGKTLHASAPTTARYGVRAVAFSPDGKLLATGGADGTVRLWNPATGHPVRAPLHASAYYGVHGVAFSPGGKLLASAGGDGTVRLWNPATGRPAGKTLQTGSGAAGGVYGVAFSPGGKLLASAVADGTVRLENPATGRPTAPLQATGVRERRERGGVQPRRQAAGQRRRRRHGAAVEPGHRPPRRRAAPDRLRPQWRRVRGGVQPQRQAGHRRQRRHRAAVGSRHRPARRRAHPDRLRPSWRRIHRGIQPRRQAAGQRRRRRHGPAVEPGHRPPGQYAHARQRQERCVGGGVQPRRQAAGQRRRRQHGAAVEPGHRPPRPRPPARQRLLRRERGGVQSQRQAAGQRRRRRHGPAVEPGHRPPRPRAPPDRHRPQFRGVRGGVQPRRQAAGRRLQRRHGPAVEPGHRPGRPRAHPRH